MLKKISLVLFLIILSNSVGLAETITLANQGTYVGDVKDGKPNGQGTLTYLDGEKYIGQWKDCYRDGKGKLTYVDGSVYV